MIRSAYDRGRCDASTSLLKSAGALASILPLITGTVGGPIAAGAIGRAAPKFLPTLHGIGDKAVGAIQQALSPTSKLTQTLSGPLSYLQRVM